MDESQKNDRRLIERGIASRRAPKEEVEGMLEALPDLSENVATPNAQDLEKFAADLTAERELRAERIQRAIERASEPPPAPPAGPVEPFEESEL